MKAETVALKATCTRLEEENTRLQGELTKLDLEQQRAQVQLEELRRLAEQHATDRGMLDAEAARLRAENGVLAAESRDDLLRLQSLEAQQVSGDKALASLSVSASAHAESPIPMTGSAKIAAAEDWVLHQAAALPANVASRAYSGRVCIQFSWLVREALLPHSVVKSEAHRSRVASALESGDAARAALQAYRVHDLGHRGHLEWSQGEVFDYIKAIFNQHGMEPPAREKLHTVVDRFAEDRACRIDAQDCVCLADALLRGTVYTSGTGSATMSQMEALSAANAPTSAAAMALEDVETDVEARLRRRLEEAERAAERALAKASAKVQEQVQALPAAAPASWQPPVTLHQPRSTMVAEGPCLKPQVQSRSESRSSALASQQVQSPQLSRPSNLTASPWQLSSSSTHRPHSGVPLSSDALFDTLDRNRDGVLTRDELLAAGLGGSWQPHATVAKEAVPLSAAAAGGGAPPQRAAELHHLPQKQAALPGRATVLSSQGQHLGASRIGGAVTATGMHTLDPARVQQVASAAAAAASAAAQAATTSLHHHHHQQSRTGVWG